MSKLQCGLACLIPRAILCKLRDSCMVLLVISIASFKLFFDDTYREAFREGEGDFVSGVQFRRKISTRFRRDLDPLLCAGAILDGSY